MLAPIVRLTFAVCGDRHPPAAKPTDDTTRHQVTATLAARYAATVGSVELGLRDERFVDRRKPLIVVALPSEIGLVLQNRKDRRVLDARCVSDSALGLSIGTHAEDATDGIGIVVRYEIAIIEAIPGWRPVHPPSLTQALRHAQPDILGELLPVELSERSEDVVEHPTRRRGKIQILGEGEPTGDLRADLIAELDVFVQGLQHSKLPEIIVAAMERAPADPRIRAMHESMTQISRDPVWTVVAAAIERDELDSGLDEATAGAHTLGPILYQCLFANTPITPADIERAIDAFLAAFAT